MKLNKRLVFLLLALFASSVFLFVALGSRASRNPSSIAPQTVQPVQPSSVPVDMTAVMVREEVPSSTEKGASENLSREQLLRKIEDLNKEIALLKKQLEIQRIKKEIRSLSQEFEEKSEKKTSMVSMPDLTSVPPLDIRSLTSSSVSYGVTAPSSQGNNTPVRPSLKFIGGSKYRKVAMISYAGGEVLLQEGQRIDNYVVKAITDSSVELLAEDGKSIFLYPESASIQDVERQNTASTPNRQQ